jgi:hypothetical protein
LLKLNCFGNNRGNLFSDNTDVVLAIGVVYRRLMTLLRLQRLSGRSRVVALGLILAAAISAEAQAPNAKDVPTLARETSPSVVRIVIRNQSGEELGSGSGFVVSNDGKIVTNYHVVHVAGMSQAEARFTEGASYQIQGVLASDPEKDLAVLKLRAVGKEFKPLHLSLAQVQTGEHVVAIGSPLAGLAAVSTEATVSDGIVSGIRDWPEHHMNVLQITAPISPGSSGGALLNSNGEVIGVTFAQLVGGQNLNFAIPSTYITQLEAGASGSVSPFPLQQDDQKMASQPPTATPQEILQSAKTLCVWVDAGSAVLKSEFSSKLQEWGKLTLVSSPSQADLVIEITQTGQLNTGGNQATATLKDRVSGIELWSKTKGGGWSMSGWSSAGVARALASEFTKFFDHAMKSASKQASRGKG